MKKECLSLVCADEATNATVSVRSWKNKLNVCSHVYIFYVPFLAGLHDADLQELHWPTKLCAFCLTLLIELTAVYCSESIDCNPVGLFTLHYPGADHTMASWFCKMTAMNSSFLFLSCLLLQRMLQFSFQNTMNGSRAKYYWYKKLAERRVQTPKSIEEYRTAQKICTHKWYELKRMQKLCKKNKIWMAQR